jgi:hypothetical protein
VVVYANYPPKTWDIFATHPFSNYNKCVPHTIYAIEEIKPVFLVTAT